jgi:hypothetical protein
MGDRVKETKLPILYVHGTGGQDELVFDGASFGLDGAGLVTYQAETFREATDIVDFDGAAVRGPMARPLTEEEVIYRALMTGTADYVNKNRFPGVLLGLSGGVDSALVLAICVDALGADPRARRDDAFRLHRAMSLEDAREMAVLHGVKYTEIAMAPLFHAYKTVLAPTFGGRPEDTTEENLQSRIRGTLLMALSTSSARSWSPPATRARWRRLLHALRRHGGGYAVIKDIVKTLVYRLSNWRNTQGYAIPRHA